MSRWKTRKKNWENLPKHFRSRSRRENNLFNFANMVFLRRSWREHVKKNNFKTNSQTVITFNGERSILFQNLEKNFAEKVLLETWKAFLTTNIKIPSTSVKDFWFDFCKKFSYHSKTNQKSFKKLWELFRTADRYFALKLWNGLWKCNSVFWIFSVVIALMDIWEKMRKPTGKFRPKTWKTFIKKFKVFEMISP